MVASFSNSGPDVNGRLYRSTDFGLTWTALSLTGFAYPPALATSADANRAYTQQSYFQSGIEVVQFPVQPALKFARLSETNCALSWTVPSSNFVAERASDLSGSNWIDLGATPVLTGYDHRIVLSSNLFASTNAQFFRLRSFPSP